MWPSMYVFTMFSALDRSPDGGKVSHWSPPPCVITISLICAVSLSRPCITLSPTAMQTGGHSRPSARHPRAVPRPLLLIAELAPPHKPIMPITETHLGEIESEEKGGV